MNRGKLPNSGTTIFTVMSALASENNAINLSQGFPDFDAPRALREALARRTLDGHNQYAPMAGLPALRDQIAAQLLRFQAVSVNADTEITVVPGATEGIFCAIMACIHPGDEVIVFDPCYDSYEPAIRMAGGRAMHVPLRADSYQIDWQLLRDAVTPATRMIIINTPHNPTGSVLGEPDLQQLEDLVELHNLWVVSDEVYEHLVYDGHRHRGVLHYPGLRERSFAVYSFGKTFSVTGWKTGYCVAPPPLTAELRKVHQFVTFVAVTPIQWALADFLAAHPEYPGTLAASYQARRDQFCSALAGSNFSLRPSAGTFFQLLDYSALSSECDTELAQRWTREAGVASIPISVFYETPPAQHLLRFCFAKNAETLDQATRLLCQF